MELGAKQKKYEAFHVTMRGLERQGRQQLAPFHLCHWRITMKISRQDLLKVGFSTAVVGIAGVACSDDAGRAPVNGAAGAGNTGGATGSGGARTGSGGAKTGGATGSGGAKTGGATGSGGAKTGGAPNNTSGGAPNTSGGAPNTSGGASQGSGGSQGTGMCASEPVITMDGQHEHPVTVPLTDVMAGVEKTYTLDMGEEGHTHMMTVTAANFTTLKTTGTVTVTSTAAGHTHDVTLMCEGGGGGGSGGAVDNGSGGAPVDDD